MGIEEVIKKYIDEEYAFIEINKNYDLAIKKYIYNECRGWFDFIEEAKNEKAKAGKLFCEANVRCIRLSEEYRRLAADLSIEQLEELINNIHNASLSIDDINMTKIYKNIIYDLNRLLDEKKEITTTNSRN